ncbi:MAG: response regulator transcription factor [Firmicutes bacterium]|nr:response regulator transcription factor [Bacillota bacterium]
MKLLIVEDSPKINQLLTLFAKQDGHDVSQAFSAESAIEHIRKTSFDVIITDLMLPDMQGEELIQIARSISDVYIIVVSAKSDLHDKLDVLTQGADDYITKPFNVEEIMIKLKNVQKRISNKHPLVHSYDHGNLKIFPMLREVELNQHLIDLTPHEFDVLWYLSNHPNRVYSRDEIIDACFTHSDAYDRVIDVYIKNIRKKLGDDTKISRYIKTHYSIGYQFVGEIDD